jgi:hypothetical protein
MSTDDESTHDPRLPALDTGGRMTDSFIVDQEANYIVGKAQTTPSHSTASRVPGCPGCDHEEDCSSTYFLTL